jgi:hypothetical protein
MFAKKRRMTKKEKYDSEMPVCNNQADFNEAVKTALEYTQDKEMQQTPVLVVLLWLLFLVWAVMLAVKIPAGPKRTMHILFAMLASPLYVLSHYLGMSVGSGNTSA